MITIGATEHDPKWDDDRKCMTDGYERHPKWDDPAYLQWLKEIWHVETVTVNDIIVTDAIFGCGFIKTVDEIPKKYESIKNTEGFETFVKGIIVKILDYDTFIAFSTDHINQVFINLIMKIDAEVLEGLDAHGVVGQTAKYKGPPRKSMGPNGAGIVQGSYRDYEVSDLFDDDFKFNKWKSVEEKLSA